MKSICTSLAAFCLSGLSLVAGGQDGITDTLAFGNPDSEKTHAVTASLSDTSTGGLGEPMRVLNPKNPVSWDGGTVSFTMKVDGEKQNYFTARFWGGDRSVDRLFFYCEGKQIGYRHLGDIDDLDSPNGRAAYPGRWYYNTFPLPLAMTKDHAELHFEIRSSGRIWGYGTNFDQYQKPMTEATRGLYRVYTQTSGFFTPPADEKQGEPPAKPPIRQAPGEEVLAQVESRVNSTIDGMLKDSRPLGQDKLWFLARAYHINWTSAYQNPAIIQKEIQGLDALFVAYQKDPMLAKDGPDIYNNGWFGVGPAAAAVLLLADPLKPVLDQEIAGAPGVTRRAGFAQMFVACRDQHRINRRQYTNQTMITDTYGIYIPNRAIALLDDKLALSEKDALHYLYEAVALQPWLGSDKDVPGMEKQKRTDWNLGDHYLQLTNKGLTKELGFVGYYGEVLDWVTAMYDATRPAPDQPGDEKIKAQLIRIAHGRAVFRAPGLDEEGNRAMLAETIVGWRDADHYPGDVVYAQRATWDSGTLGVAAATLDPTMIGYVQQMFDDHQFFAGVAESLQNKSLRVLAGLMEIPNQYYTLKSLPGEAARLPMSDGQPDFAFADEEDGVVAVKHGDERFYASLYWRARNAINFLARVHDTQPAFDRIAVVHQDEQFESSGLEYTRPDWINMAFGNGGIHYPGDLHSAHAGEKLPIAKIPAEIPFKPGNENPYAGRASFYQLRYGPYLVGMNASKDKTFQLSVPKEIEKAPDLVSGKTVETKGSVSVAPESTVILYLGQ